MLVGIDAAGAPVSVRVVQRLTLHGLGDYTFAVPGPAVDVTAAPGSASEPGLRRGSILWSGFSPGQKTLAARAALRLAAAAPALPARVTITQADGTVTLRVDDTTGTPGLLLAGPADARAAAAALDATRRTARDRPVLHDIYVLAPRPPKSKRERIFAPVRVTGDVRFAGGRRVPVDALLGDRGPHHLVVRVANVSGEPVVRLVVRAVPPSRLLAPPRGSTTWQEAVRAHRVDPSRLLELASRARLTTARARDFQTFLVNPDPRGTSSATYVYATAPAAVAAQPGPSAHKRRDRTSAIVVVLLVLAAGGLVVLWAHS